MVLGELDSYMQKKMKLGHQLTPYAKMNSRWIKNLNISGDNIKIKREQTVWENVFTNDTSDKGLISKI